MNNNEDDIQHPADSSEPMTDEASKVQELEAKVQEYLQGWQRAKADLANYRRDEATRMHEMAKYGNADLIRELITVMDSFDLAIASLEKQGGVEKGVYMIRAQIEDVLKKRGLQKIEIVKGDAYDPALAEAIAEAEVDGVLPGHVVDVIEPGYRLHEKVVRPARVRVAK